jgi:hypothetical protein
MKTIITIFITVIISQIIGHFYISNTVKDGGLIHKKTKIKYHILALIIWPTMLVILLTYLKKYTSAALYSLLSYIIGVIIIALTWTNMELGFFWKAILYQGFVTVVLSLVWWVIIYSIVGVAQGLKDGTLFEP